MKNSENISEEIVIVGSKVDGELTGEFALLSEQETPIRVNNGIRAAVGDVVYLMPVSNDHADLSAKSYNILLTLLAVRNLMKIKLGDEKALSALSSAAADEALFHFIHPSIDEAKARLIHIEVKRLVARHAMQHICRYLSQMKAEKRLLLPMSLSPIFDELVRMGMPQTGGYSKKNFEKYYSR